MDFKRISCAELAGLILSTEPGRTVSARFPEGGNVTKVVSFERAELFGRDCVLAETDGDVVVVSDTGGLESLAEAIGEKFAGRGIRVLKKDLPGEPSAAKAAL